MTHLWRFYHLKSLYLCLDISLKSANFKTLSILYIFVDNFSNKTLKLHETNLVRFFSILLTKITDKDFLKTSFETYISLAAHSQTMLIFKIPKITLDSSHLIQMTNVDTFLFELLYNI